MPGKSLLRMAFNRSVFSFFFNGLYIIRLLCVYVVVAAPLVLTQGTTVPPVMADSPPKQRFFFSGNGEIQLKSNKSGKMFRGRYRDEYGHYSDQAYKTILSVFGAPHTPQRRVVSLRLIEFLDYLQDHFRPEAMLTITSGYRAPQYNTRLRKKGALAAKASLHQYGMAADLIMEGVPSKQIWAYVQSLGFGGTGYYHGKTVHIDVGPARFWDEKSSGVGLGLADDNKLIGLITDFDIYRPGETITLSFIRMTAFPIEVNSEFFLIAKRDDHKLRFKPDVKISLAKGCVKFADITSMLSIQWKLPADISQGSYTIEARFCGDSWKQMPKEIVTPEFEIR